MNFEFSSDQMLLKDQARKFLEGEESVKKARDVLEGDQVYDESLWKSIIEMGFTATTIPEGFIHKCISPSWIHKKQGQKLVLSDALAVQCQGLRV